MSLQDLIESRSRSILFKFVILDKIDINYYRSIKHKMPIFYQFKTDKEKTACFLTTI